MASQPLQLLAEKWGLAGSSNVLALPWDDKEIGLRVDAWLKNGKMPTDDRWVVICPFCHGVHEHGPMEGWRVPHCPGALKSVAGRSYQYYLVLVGLLPDYLNHRPYSDAEDADSLLRCILDQKSRPSLDKVGGILEADPDTGHVIAQLTDQGASIKDARIAAAQELFAKGPIEIIRAVQRAIFGTGSVA